MADTYKGESPSKKLARYSFWMSVAGLLGQERFQGGKHLVLASREAGDVSVLLALGVKPKNIIAVDHNAEACALAQKKFPEVRFICDDVAKVARRFNRECISCLLDFCAPMMPRVLDGVLQVALQVLKDDGILGCAFLSAREQGELKDDVEASRREAEEELEACLGQVDEDLRDELLCNPDSLREYGLEHIGSWVSDLEHGGHRMRERLRQFRVLVREHGVQSSTVRVFALSKQIFNRCAKFNVFTRPKRAIYYCSDTRKSKGVPMLIYMSQISRAPPRWSFDRFVRTMADRYPNDLSVPKVDTFSLTENDLRDLILGLQEKHPRMPVSLLYNVSKGTIAAWKAHRTMGTYTHDPRPLTIRNELIQ